MVHLPALREFQVKCDDLKMLGMLERADRHQDFASAGEAQITPLESKRVPRRLIDTVTEIVGTRVLAFEIVGKRASDRVADLEGRDTAVGLDPSRETIRARRVTDDD